MFNILNCVMASFDFDDVVFYGWCFWANDFVWLLMNCFDMIFCILLPRG